MKLHTRLALFASLAALGMFASTGCGKSDTTTPDAGGGGGSDGSCLEDSDCPDQQLFFCNQLTSKCEPSCHSKEDCSAAVRGEFALDYCAGNLGCQCDEGKCVASLCSADVDCGASSVCRNGACVAAPAASEATKCQIIPDYVVTTQNSTLKFSVSTWKGNEPLVVKDGITWTAAAPLSGNATGTSGSFTASGTATTATDALTVTVGSATCKAKVVSLAAQTSGLRVVVTDELSGRPVTGADVVLSNPTTGAQVGTLQTTSSDGIATFASVTAAVNVNVFSTTHNYLTIVNYDAATGSKTLSAVLRRNQTDKYGGYKGTFTNVPTSPNIKAGIAGMSIAGSVTDLSVTQLLGPTVPTDVVIGTIVNQQDVPLPAGTFLQYDTNVIKGTVSAQGLAGICTDASGNPDEAKILAGTCGTRTAWALAGDVPLSEISGAASSITGGVDNINYGQLLSQVLPIFKRFNSSVSRDVQFTLENTPGSCASSTSCTYDPDFSNTTNFVTVDHDFQQMPLGFNFVVAPPDLPQFKNTYVDGLILLGGSIVPGRGVVPLGLGIGVNQNPVDPKTDAQSGLNPGNVTMRMAPTHHGLEGTQYGVIALAASLKSATDASAGLATSALFQRVASNKLAFDPTGQSGKVTIEGSFLPFPEGAKYNFTGNAYGGIPTGRTFKFTTTLALTGLSVVRVSFTDMAEHRWNVLVSPTDAASTAGFTLPDPTTLTGASHAWEDRTFSNGVSTGSRSTMMVQTLSLADGTTTIDFKKLVELNGTNADALIDYTRAFTVYDYSRPTVSWITPTNNGTVAPGGTVKVGVKHFKVGNNAGSGDEGGVKVDCGTGTNTSVTSYTDASQGKGEISLTLPSGCTGAGKTLTATLVDIAGNPIKPDVATSITANIQ